MAIAKAKKDGKCFANKTNIEFSVVDISDCMGWDSGPVKRELKMLMWNLNGKFSYKLSSVRFQICESDEFCFIDISLLSIYSYKMWTAVSAIVWLPW